MKYFKIIFFGLFILGLKLNAQAQETQLTPAASKPAEKAGAGRLVKQQKGENLLDFEAEVIEGEKKRPELFIEIKAGDGHVGSGLYMRPHYDDFFVVDKKRRPKFIKSK
jgi:hypothetical protein